MITELGSMCNCHLGKTGLARQIIEISSPDFRPIHHGSNIAGPKGKGLEKARIDNVLDMKDISIA